MEKVRPWCGQPSDRGRLKVRSYRIVSCGETYNDDKMLTRICTWCGGVGDAAREDGRGRRTDSTTEAQ